MSEIDVSRDLLDIKLDFFTEREDTNTDFFVELSDWQSTKIKLLFNFSNPSLISQGRVIDKVYVKVKDP